MNNNRAIVAAACVVAGIIIGAGFRSCAKQEPQTVEVEKHDTIIIRDTLRINEHTKLRTIVRVDTIWISKPTDFGEVKDTTNTDADYALVPITQSEYRDTIANDSSRAEIKVLFSGYNACIDEIGINYHTRTKTRVERKKNGWGQFVGIGVGVGYGASVVGQRIYAAPEIGLHITYGWGYHW
jgi:hypothetical protein